MRLPLARFAAWSRIAGRTLIDALASSGWGPPTSDNHLSLGISSSSRLLSEEEEVQWRSLVGRLGG